MVFPMVHLLGAGRRRPAPENRLNVAARSGICFGSRPIVESAPIMSTMGLLPLNRIATAILEGKAQLDQARPIAVHCKGGYRSAIAASLLLRAGFRQVVNVTGGFDAWKAAGLPVAQVAVA